MPPVASPSVQIPNWLSRSSLKGVIGLHRHDDAVFGRRIWIAEDEIRDHGGQLLRDQPRMPRSSSSLRDERDGTQFRDDVERSRKRLDVFLHSA